MPAPGTSGKMPAIRNTVAGHRSSTAQARESRMTSTVAKNVASVGVRPA